MVDQTIYIEALEDSQLQNPITKSWETAQAVKTEQREAIAASSSEAAHVETYVAAEAPPPPKVAVPVHGELVLRS